MSPGLPQPHQLSDEPRNEYPSKSMSTSPSSTATQSTPQLFYTEAERESDGDELLTGSEKEGVASGPETLKSGAERSAGKRKMKRFRLTPAQTRYLTSEFSRQPHPDASHRERLSWDIPGLNPRQVQVWFQNKRAKLERLTGDDQQRMRRSRALPEDFEFTQTLHPTFGEARLLHGSALTDSIVLGVGVSRRPSRRLGIAHLSTASTSMNSSFTSHVPSPVFMIDSAKLSPTSSVNEPSQGAGPYFPITESSHNTRPQFTNPFGCYHSLSSDSITFQRENQHLSQNGMMRLGYQVLTNTSSPNSTLTNDTFDFTNLPLLHIDRTPLQLQEDHRFDSSYIPERSSQASVMGLDQYYRPPIFPPSNVSHDQSHILYPPRSASRALYYQSQNIGVPQGTQMSPQQYQDGQRLQPHRTAKQRRGSDLTQGSSSPIPSVNRYDQRSYSHSGHYYRCVKSSTEYQSQQMSLGVRAATGLNTQQIPDAARPRAMSATFPGCYNTQQ